MISYNGKSLPFYPLFCTVDENTPDREFIIIKMTKCHFDNYMISLNKEIPSLMTIRDS